MSPRTRRSAPRTTPFGGQSFREPPLYRRNRRVGRLTERFSAAENWAPADEPVWAVRVEIRPLSEESSPVVRPSRVPAELVQALEGARELRAVGNPSEWRLICDGEFIGTVSRPTDVHLAEVLPPESASESRVIGEPAIPGSFGF